LKLIDRRQLQFVVWVEPVRTRFLSFDLFPHFSRFVREHFSAVCTLLENFASAFVQVLLHRVLEGELHVAVRAAVV
jgi:hypothetical protein